MISNVAQLSRRIVNGAHRRIASLFSPSPVSRHQNPYATLLPVLAAIAAHREIRKVVELGCGYNSTPAFLRKDVFRDLTSIVSVENDPQWAKQICNHCNDPRLTMHEVTGTIAESVSKELLQDADLTLVDDSTNSEDRSNTIRAVAAVSSDDTIVLIHDFENEQYRTAASGWSHVLVADALLPQTAVLSNRPCFSRREWAEINRTMRVWVGRLELSELSAWVKVFGGHAGSS